MIDETVLTDSTRCPSCLARLTADPTCAVCGVSLTGPEASRLWTLSVQAADLLAQRSALLAAMRAAVGRAPARTPGAHVMGQVPLAGSPAGATAAAAGSLGTAGPRHGATAAAAGSVGTAGPRTGPMHSASGIPSAGYPARPLTPPAPRPEWTLRRVQNLLLGLGVGLLAVAAVIFLVVSWGSLGVGGRAAVMTGCTAVAAGAATFSRKRSLGATAEALAALTVALTLLDAYGARSAGLAGLDTTSGELYWAGALTTVVAALVAWAAVIPLRATRVSAAVLVQLPLLLVAGHLAQDAAHPLAVIALGLTLQAAALALVANVRPFGEPGRDAHATLGIGAIVAWCFGVLAAGIAAYDESGSLLSGAILLTVLAAVAATAAVLVPASLDRLRQPLLGAAALVALLAAWAPVVDQLDESWLALAMALAAGALLAAAAALPTAWRVVPARVFAVAAVAPALSALPELVVACVGRIDWLTRAWSATGQQDARALVAHASDQLLVTWHASTPLLLLAAALVLLLAGRVVDLRIPSAAAVPFVGASVLVTAPSLELTFPGALALDLGVAAAALVGATFLGRGALRWATTAGGALVMALGLAWAFAQPVATLVALPVGVGVLLAAAVLERLRPADLTWLWPSEVVAASALAVIEAGALARHSGAGWPALWTLVLGLLVAAGLSGAPLTDGTARRAGAMIAAIAAVGDSVAVCWWAGGSTADLGLTGAVAAAVLLGAAGWAGRVVGDDVAGDVLVVGAFSAALAVPATALDSDRLWLALLAVGVGMAVLAARPGMHRAGWLAGLLLTASSWVRLADSHVTAPEAYTVPAAVVLLAVGFLQRRREQTTSWRAYGSGLALALTPSLARAVTDTGATRPVLLGLAALVVVLVGVVRRLQAPLLLGGAVLAVDALVQLAPYLAQAYDAVPRWVAIATAGLLLVVVGATYERRVGELRRLRHSVARLG
ncbi:MAG: hypothetical protein QOE01_2631 [Actinomycetota bacterium]|nr:hypothetical protein [Actinomycetota bacterium]